MITMKTKIFIIIVCCILGTRSNKAQEIFPTSDAIWNIRIDGRECFYGLSGNVTINDTLYQKLYLLNDTTLNIDSGDLFIGGFRQEDKKVWFRPDIYDDSPNNQGEMLLYDFSKNIGDTIWHGPYILHGVRQEPYFEYMDYDGRQLISIVTDTTINNGIVRYEVIQILIDNDDLIAEEGGSFINGDYWKEGVGSVSRGLFWFLYQAPMSGGTSYELACFKHNNKVEFLNEKCNKCFYWSGANIEKNNMDHMNISVICKNDWIQVLGEPSIFPCKIEIFNLKGQLIDEKNIFSDNNKIKIKDESVKISVFQILKDNKIIKSGKIKLK